MANIFKKITGEKETIKIGNLAPLSGEYGCWGVRVKEGLDLALEEINKIGGINGQLVEIIHEDDKIDPVYGVQAFNKLVFVDKVWAVIGPINSDSLIAIAPFAKNCKTVLLSAIAGAANIPDSGGYVFRIFPTTDQEAKSLVEAAVGRGNKTAAILYINNAYGLGLAKAARRFAAERGIEFLIVEGYKQETADFSEQLGRIKQKNPQAVFLFGYPKDIGLILKQAKEIDLVAVFFAPDTFAEPAVESVAGNLAKDIIYVMPGGEFLPEFVAAFEKKYRKAPNFIDAMNYDALKLLALAISRASNQGEAVRNELLKIKDYAGALGSISFDQCGRATNRSLLLKTIRG